MLKITTRNHKSKDNIRNILNLVFLHTQNRYVQMHSYTHICMTTNCTKELRSFRLENINENT